MMVFQSINILKFMEKLNFVIQIDLCLTEMAGNVKDLLRCLRWENFVYRACLDASRLQGN